MFKRTGICILVLFLTLSIWAHRPKILPISDFFKGQSKLENFLLEEPKENLCKFYGKDIKRTDYMKWLVDQADEELFDRFIQDSLVRKKAEKEGFVPENRDIFLLVRKKVEEEVQKMYFTPESERMTIRSVLKEKYLREVRKYYQLSLLIKKDTEFTEDLMHQEFKARHGINGKKYWLKFLHFVPNKYFLRKGQEGYKEAVLELEDDAKSRLEKVLKKLEKKKGNNFSELAFQYSDDKDSFKIGGTIGNFTKGQYGGDFDKIIPTMKKGQLSDVIKSRKGYHIVKVISKSGDDIEIAHIFKKVNYFSVPDRAKWQRVRAEAMKERGKILKKVEFGRSLLTEREVRSIWRMFGYTSEPGWENDWDKVFGQTLKKMKKSEVSDFIELDQGLFVFRVSNLRSQQLNDKMKETLQDEISYQLAIENYDSYTKELAEKADISIYF